MASKVLFGPYVGKTKSELLVLLRAAQEQLGTGGGVVTWGSVGGQSYTKTPGISVTERIRMITQALAQVDPDYIAPSSSVYARFSDPGADGNPCL